MLYIVEMNDQHLRFIVFTFLLLYVLRIYHNDLKKYIFTVKFKLQGI